MAFLSVATSVPDIARRDPTVPTSISIHVRKGLDESNNGDNSGDYNKYPDNKIYTLENGVDINIRGDKNKIYVMYFMAESGVYSARCEQGMTKREVEGIYNVIREAEEPKLP